jgi:hypothetical protein
MSTGITFHTCTSMSCLALFVVWRLVIAVHSGSLCVTAHHLSLKGVVLDVSDGPSWRGMPKGRNANELRGRVAWHHANSLFLLLHFLSFNNDKTASYLFVYTESLKCVLVKLKFVCPKAVLAYAVWTLGLNGVISRLGAICHEYRNGSGNRYWVTLLLSHVSHIFVVFIFKFIQVLGFP